LARWAGVGVFIFAVALSCGDDEGPTEPTPPTPSGEGFVWAATENVITENWLIKVDVGTGEIHHRGVKGFRTGEWIVGIPTVPETGEFFLHNPGVFLGRYDYTGEKIWREGSSRYNWRDFTSIGYYGKGNEVWGMEDWCLEKYDGSCGKLLLVKHIGELILKPHPPLQVDQNTGAVWAASPDYIIKLSANGVKQYDEKFTRPSLKVKNIAINNGTGDLWLIINDKIPAERYRLIKYTPSGTKLFTKDTFVNQEPTGMAIDPTNGDVWLGYEYGVLVHDKNGAFKKSLPNYDNIRVITFAGDRVIMGGGKESRTCYLYSINKETGKQHWMVKEGNRPVKYIGYVHK
jgi:outer membrane protein assembly factor BamB